MRVKYLIFSVLVVACFVGCFGRKLTCHEVAESFATNLHKYKEEKNPKYWAKLSELSSEFTMTMIDEDGFDNFFVGADKFRYRFVRDSISADRMKAYVWYANDKRLSHGRGEVKRLRLRHALRGWVVDLPLR